MSRTRKAVVSAGFTYAQFALAIIASVALVPFILHHLGARTYGFWLASGEILGYAAMLDLGVFGVLPWMIAEADGRNDRAALRSFVVQGLVVGAIVGVAYATIVGLLWWFLPAVLNLTEADRTVIGGPLALLVAVAALAYPLRVFSAVRVGLQDVTFNGILTVVQLCLNISLTVALLVNGYGLYALAAAAAIPPVVTTAAGLLRTITANPELLKEWPKPTLVGITSLLSEGLGVWFGSFGVQLMVASSSLVIVYLGHPEWVIIYWCTSRLSQVLLQVCWVLPDSGQVGLAQLQGEGRTEQVRQVVSAMLRLHLLFSGLAACVVLALNPAFVRWWVGADFFGGIPLNAIFAVGLVWASFIHGLIVPVAVLGNRLRVGVLTLLNGMMYVALAVTLGARYGLLGVAVAAPLSSMVTMLPFIPRLLQPATGVKLRWLMTELLVPWLCRIAPLLAVSGAFALSNPQAAIWLVAGFGLPLVFIYLWWMRPLYRDLMLDPRLYRYLVWLRLETPAVSTAATSSDQSSP